MKCAFCDGDAVNKGGEHLWDDWINEEIPKTRFNAKKRLSLDSSPIQFATRGLKEKIPAVCGKCNHGWMSAVTAKVKERFSGAILDGAPFSLDLGDAAVLAAFTFMKATVKDYCFGNDPFFTRADRERLRISLKLPDMARVWFAAHHGSARRTFRSNFNIASVSDRNPLQGMEFFCYTYIVGNLVLQLLAPRWKDVCDRNKPLVTLIPDSYWDPAVTKFWPYPSEAISWPPEKLLGDHVVEQFIYRFQVPINWRG